MKTLGKLRCKRYLVEVRGTVTSTFKLVFRMD